MILNKCYDVSELRNRWRKAVTRYNEESNIVKTLNALGFTVISINDDVISVCIESDPFPVAQRNIERVMAIGAETKRL